MQVKTLSGVVLTLELNGNCWTYRDALQTVSLPFLPLRGLVSKELLRTYLMVLQWYIKNVSPAHLVSVHQAFTKLAKISSTGGRKLVCLKASHMMNCHSRIGLTEMSRLRTLIKRWHAMGYPAVEEAAQFLETLRLKGGTKGAAVLTMDPVLGPYTDVEWSAVQSSVDDAFVEGKIEEDVYYLAWLFLALGQRPIQHAAMKVCDVLRTEEDGIIRFAIRVPRAKQGHSSPRSEFRTRPLIKEIGEPLHAYARKIAEGFRGTLPDPLQAPLFPTYHSREAPEGFEFHRTGASVTALLRRGLEGLKVWSERTGEQLNICAIRFRRTVGTRAAQEGHGEFVIAELLDHTDTQNVGVYVAAVPEIAERIDRAVAMQLAPLARAFKGVVIHDETEAIRGHDPASRIIDMRIDQSGHSMGSCGQIGPCHFTAPIACYTCRNFQPWADGAHEAVLEHLLLRRDALLAGDKRMASIHDRTILAVAEVVRLCVNDAR